MTGSVCDTSVLIPALADWHPEHEESRAALREGVSALLGHVMLECFSALTRLPAPHRVAAPEAAATLAALTWEPVTLPAGSIGPLIRDLASRGVRGGAVYDGLVAATAKHHELHLVTRDRRARPTYDAVGVTYTLL